MADVDWWLRVASRATTLARALRRDRDLEGDHGRETARASQVHRTIDQTARAVVGCTAPQHDCDCPMCLEKGPP